ncbi:acyltransferase [Schwartzia succinivorans]|uniref:acyltransferase n=1 Tax=Schwartzia succinivorans TaxID=55507 RepID=UPI002353A45F|nr:acyltransferase [Schwartzia succinivorans]
MKLMVADRIGLRIWLKWRNIKERIWNIYQGDHCWRGKDTYFFLSSSVNNMSQKSENIYLGQACKIRGELVVYPYAGKIIMGDYCYLGEGSRIWSENEIIIGNNVLIAHDVDIHDSNDHPIEPFARHNHFKAVCSVGFLEQYNLRAKPIHIGDNAWIGFGASIMKGVRIGRNSIVAAKSVVTHDVPDNVIVAGNPAQIVRQLSEEEIRS